MANLGAVNDDDIFDEGGTSEGVADDEATPTPPQDPAPPEPEDKAKPDAAPAPADDKPAGDDDNPAKHAPDGYVPHAALHQARLQIQDLQNQNLTMSKQLGVVEQLKVQLDEMRKAGKTSDNEDPAPNKEEDPIAYLEWENRQLKRDVQSIKDKENEQAQTDEQTRQNQEKTQQLMSTIQTQVLDYEKSQPDYSQAFTYVMNKRAGEYKAMGITNPQDMVMAFDREVMQVAVSAIQRGMNPGEAMYKLAVAQGYKKAPDGNQSDTNPAPNGGNGGDTSLKEHMDRLEKGQGAGSMGTGGEAPETGVTLQSIDMMTDAEFDAYWEKTFGNNSIYSNS